VKRVRLRNDSGTIMVFPDMRDLTFAVGEVKAVLPAVAKHPSVARKIGPGGLTDLGQAAPVTTAPKKAPESPSSLPPVPTPTPSEPIAREPEETAVEPEDAIVESAEEPAEEVVEEPSEEVVEEPSEEVVEEPAAETTGLRDEFLAGPGITESNVDAIMEAYPKFSDLAEASKSSLQKLGVAKSYTKKLLSWARG